MLLRSAEWTGWQDTFPAPSVGTVAIAVHFLYWTGRLSDLILATLEGSSMANSDYNQFCPIAKVSELVEPRWTLLILNEMWSGSSRFNEIRRGVPGMSPTLLSKRLKDMEIRGLVSRTQNSKTGHVDYALTAIARDLVPIVKALGQWAHRNVDAEISLEKLDARLLMWNMRRKIDTTYFPNGKTVIQFIFPELNEDQRNYWLITKPGHPVDLCLVDPGFDVDLYVTAELKAMTSAWMGWSRLKTEISNEKIVLSGNQKLIVGIENWMVISSFATHDYSVSTSSN